MPEKLKASQPTNSPKPERRAAYPNSNSNFHCRRRAISRGRRWAFHHGQKLDAHLPGMARCWRSGRGRVERRDRAEHLDRAGRHGRAVRHGPDLRPGPARLAVRAGLAVPRSSRQLVALEKTCS
jgi:hypothetical protein